MEAMAARNELSMFGQSGDGFHSEFLVSSTARGVNKSYDDEQCIRESGTGGSLTVQESAELVHGGIKRGTKMGCHLKQDRSEFLKERRPKDAMTGHAEFVEGSSLCFTWQSPWGMR